MDTQTQIDRLIELAIVQRTELRRLVQELPQLKEHLSAEIERTFEEAEPQMRAELEEYVTRQADDKTATLGAELSKEIKSLAAALEESAQAKFSAILAARDQNADLLKQAEERIAEAAGQIPAKVKDIVTAELARFPRAGEIDQLRKEFQEPRGLNPRGKWTSGERYNKLDLVSFNGDSFVSNIDGNTEKPNRASEVWTLSAARGVQGGGGGITSFNDLIGSPTSDLTVIGAEGNNYVQKTLVAGANITITESPTAITIIGDEGQISLQDGTAAAPSLFFTNDTDTGIYRPAANTLGISVSGTQIAYFDQNGLTVPSAGVVAGGSIHAANGNANNPSHSFQGDQDTGFFRHQSNEIGIALGGTQYATLNSTTFSITPSVTVGGTLRASGGIVGTAVGASSPSTGAFTTLSASTSLTSPDLTLGASGPSAKSSIAARAARQGLVFDGTNSATVSVPAFGTSAWTVSFWVNLNSLRNYDGLFGGASGAFTGYTDASGNLAIGKSGVGSITVSSYFPSALKTYLVTITNDGTTATIYRDGVLITTSTSANIIANYTAGIVAFGSNNNANANPLAGSLSGALVYNRALTAAEVVSLYEAGVPSGADYPTQVAGTALISGDSSTFTGGVGSWTGWSGGTVTAGSGAGTFTAPGGANTAAYLNVGGNLKYGFKYRIKLDISTLTGGNLIISDTTSGATWATFTATGSNQTAEFTINQTTNGYIGIRFSANAASAVIDNITLTPLGLLLAPDAAQAGGGLTWYDTSGNAANITLPASGVSWNVPSSAKTATGWTFGGAINATGTSVLTAGYWRTKPTADDGTLTGLSLANSSGAQVGVVDVNTLTGDIRVGGTNSSYPLALYSKSVAVMTFGASSAATLAGNLTVSGTGTSSVAGKLIAGSATADYAVSKLQSNGALVVYGGAITNAPDAPSVVIDQQVGGVARIMASGTNTWSVPLCINPYGGNLLVGTTTDGGQKLQVAGTGYVSGDFTSGSNLRSSGATNTIRVRGNSQYIDFTNLAENAYVNGIIIANTLNLYGNNGTGLSIDPTGFGTFSGNVSIGGANGNLTIKGTGGTASNLNADNNLNINVNSSGAAKTIAISTAGSVTLPSGAALQLGNAYVAGAPTATGYVTIKDSAGNTYKVLVGT